MTTHPCVVFLEYHLRLFDDYFSGMALCQPLTPEERTLFSSIRRANSLNVALWSDTLTIGLPAR